MAEYLEIPIIGKVCDLMLIVYPQYSITRNTFQIPVLLIMIVFLSIFSFIRFAYFQYSLYICRKIEMNDDIFESVSQRSSGEETAENRRIYEIANELHRRCQLYEAQLRVGQVNVNRLEVEQRIAELYAKETGMWIPFGGVFDLGTPGPSGNENDTYVSNDIIYKVNNLLNTGSILRLLNRLIWHNNLFYDTAYSLYGFTGFDGRTVMPIMTQRLVKDALPATAIEIETYMAAIGFVKQNKEGRFSNGIYDVWDLVPRNVLKDKDGDIFIVDAEINIK